MKKILTLQDLVNSSWGERFHEAFGDNLIAAFLHGNCLYEGFDALHESWQVSFILKKTRPSDLQNAHKISREMVKDNLKFGYFFSEDFLQKDTISDGERSAFFHSVEKKPSMQFPKETFEAALRRFARDVSEIRALCSKKTVSLRDFSRVETAAALLFATEAQFEKLVF